MSQREEFERDIYSNVEHTITSGNVLVEKETGRVAAVFYNDYDLDSIINHIAGLEAQLNVATKLLDERKDEIERLKVWPDYKLPSDVVARFSGHNETVEALQKACLVAAGYNECREEIKLHVKASKGSQS